MPATPSPLAPPEGRRRGPGHPAFFMYGRPQGLSASKDVGAIRLIRLRRRTDYLEDVGTQPLWQLLAVEGGCQTGGELRMEPVSVSRRHLD